MFRFFSARQVKTSVPWSLKSGLSAQHRKKSGFMLTMEEIQTELVKNEQKAIDANQVEKFKLRKQITI
jgi:hypothetical protein